MSFTTAQLNAAVDGALSGASHVQLHTGDPGGSGTSSVATNVSGRVQVTGGSFDGASSGQTEEVVNFTITSGGEEYTHISIWDDPTAGNFYASGTLSPFESFSNSGSLEVTVTVSAANA